MKPRTNDVAAKLRNHGKALIALADEMDPNYATRIAQREATKRVKRVK